MTNLTSRCKPNGQALALAAAILLACLPPVAGANSSQTTVKTAAASATTTGANAPKSITPIHAAKLQTMPTGLSPEEASNIIIYKLANKAVVNIASVATSSEDVYFNIVPREGCGSGTIISPDGYILTNYHVVEGANAVRVTLFDGSNYAAQLVGTDPSNDLAVIKINPGTKKLSTLPMGDSSGLEVGRRVLAIGNPFGLDRTLTTGIVSSLGRTLKTENERVIKGIIQTDAAINPGNSGGPLLDGTGKMVGITTAIFSRTGQSAGIGLAIPINIAKRIVPELIAHHGVSRPDLGIQLVDVNDAGLRVIKLDPGGPAAKAGLSGPKLVIYRDGPFSFQAIDQSFADVISFIDNVPVHSVDDLLSYVEQKKPGQVVTLTVLRQGKVVKIPVKLAMISPS